MKFFQKMERKYGRYAIHGLTKYIIATYVVGYLLSILAPNILGYLLLEPALILRGQVWRLVTWVMIPPAKLDFFTIIMLFFYYSIGTNLERAWGNFRYQVYIFSGLIFTVVGAFLLYFIGGGIFGISVSAFFSTYYISMSIFLAFALTYPDMQVLVYFLIPVKMKWLGILDVILLASDFVRTPFWGQRVAIIASLLNVIIFFLMTRNYKRISPKEVKRKKEFQKAVRINPQGTTNHKCVVCGRTEKDDPTLEFRYCSKCNGNYEYCQDHLFTHEHVK